MAGFAAPIKAHQIVFPVDLALASLSGLKYFCQSSEHFNAEAVGKFTVQIC